MKLNEAQQLGLAGAGILLAGVFTPIYRLGEHTATLAMTWVGFAAGIAAVGAAISFALRQGWVSLVAGLAAFAAAGYRFAGMEKLRSDAVADITSGSEEFGDWGKAIAGGLADRLSDALAPQWGWWVIGVGIAMVLLASILLLRDQKES